MTDQTAYELDAALAGLAADVRANTPRPGPDLIARVLADAAEVAAAHRPVTVAARPGGGRARSRIVEILLGWQCGAVAAMAVALVVGIGVGMEIDTSNIPMMEAEEDDGVFFTADAGFLPDDFL